MTIKYVLAKQLADGGTAYYWQPPIWARKKGCPLIAERLGRDLATVITRASELNGAFDAWRKGEDKGAIVPGSVAWLRRLYERDEAFTDLAESTQKDYSAKLCWSASPSSQAAR